VIDVKATNKDKIEMLESMLFGASADAHDILHKDRSQPITLMCTFGLLRKIAGFYEHYIAVLREFHAVPGFVPEVDEGQQRLIRYLEAKNAALNDNDQIYQEMKDDQVVLQQVKERLETWWPQLTQSEYGKRVQEVAPAAEFLVECYEAVCRRIRIV
jgi:hypothetical protein